MREHNVILVGGSGRSGTTVLNKILARHPDVVVTPPWRFMIDPDGVLEFLCASRTRWSPYDINTRLKRLRRLLDDVTYASPANKLRKVLRVDKLQERLGLSLLPRYAHLNAADHCPGFAKIADALVEELCQFRYSARWVGARLFEAHEMMYAAPEKNGRIAAICARFYANVVEATLAANAAKYFVDRNTWNHIWFDEMLNVAPQAKLLHIYRDPRDVTASYVRQNWMPGNAVQAATIYRDMMEYWWRVRDRVPDGSYLELSLEALVEGPDRELRKICEFTGIPWDEALLSVPLNKSNAGCWVDDIPVTDHAQVNDILAPVLECLGYS